MKTIAVLGAGPSGLAVAHAAIISGHKVKIFSKGEKSRLYGCQYLHEALPEMPDVMQTTVRYELWGTAKEYRDKVYGGLWTGEVSPEGLKGYHKAWDIRAAYDWLWKTYVESEDERSQFVSMHIKESLLTSMTFGADMIVSTIPVDKICADPFHQFVGNEIWAVGDAPDLGQLAPVTAPEDTIMCNGEDAPAWYRVSKVFGIATVEWPGRKKPPIPYAAKVNKPLYTNCDCWPKINRLGRYGAWKKGELVHQVFNKAMELFQ